MFDVSGPSNLVTLSKKGLNSQSRIQLSAFPDPERDRIQRLMAGYASVRTIKLKPKNSDSRGAGL